MNTKRLNTLMKEHKPVKLFVLMRCNTCNFNIEAEVRDVNEKMFCPICKSTRNGIMEAIHILDFKEL